MDNVGIDLAAGGLVFFLIWVVLVVVGLGLHIWALIDAIQNRRLSDNERIVWIIVIIFVGCLGPILYFAIGRNKRPPGSPEG